MAPTGRREHGSLESAAMLSARAAPVSPASDCALPPSPLEVVSMVRLKSSVLWNDQIETMLERFYQDVFFGLVRQR